MEKQKTEVRMSTYAKMIGRSTELVRLYRKNKIINTIDRDGTFYVVLDEEQEEMHLLYLIRFKLNSEQASRYEALRKKYTLRSHRYEKHSLQ